MYNLEYPWLLALLPLPLLIWWLLPPYREETASIRLPFFNEVAHASGAVPSRGALIPTTNWPERLLAPVCWTLVVIALARPQYVDPPIRKVQPARDLLLALDLSQSMDTRDFKNSGGALIPRVEAVRSVVADFVKRRTDDRVGMIVFGDAPYPEAPFTLDHVTVETMIAGAIPGMAGPRTALGDAIGLAIKMFADSKAPEKVLVALTDGNDTASKMPLDRAADIAKQNGIRIHTVGIGNPDAVGEDKLDALALEKVAATTGGQYFFGQDQSELEKVYATLDRITPSNATTLSWRPRRELFHYPLGAALALLTAYHLLMWLWTTSRAPRRVAAP
ncbi:Ca-activated chloride channel family protein [Tardiphaga sp. OK246]|uniref:VWA domain-containing protein n=1 Tax=Tardiphaga sp. OK246 TaxID=1855307 RepID=UPI000B7326C0|nr:VWA domain-containing protein [Tardiphaga sp. OK246]SNT12059.1 Ca-activated chloride channel family protein [Tardiphaga sp. OK246]